ncbi:MAG: fumarylacetoacetate hydrolase family protein, partial [Alphaproteobacteria bacterium]
MTDYLFEPTAPTTIPIIGSDKLYPVNRIFCVGRNYEAHAAEMGAVVDREAPFYFTKSPTTLVMAEGEIAYAPRTENYHYEMELVFALKSGGTNIAEADALTHIYGCAAGLDMTRRDLQNKAKENRKPWDTAKDVDESAVITPLRQMSEVPSVASGRIHLSQNGTIKQDADLSEMVWSVPEIIADLSTMYTLRQGDVIYMG